MDPSAIGELFERNADMRLLELRHSESGRTPNAVRHVPTSFGEESVADTSADVPVSDAPRLRVGIAAVPNTGVIPGALVGVAIDVFNDGTAPAPESKLVISLPIETEFRNGTLRVDGREVQAPDRLFGAGLPIARLPGGTSSKVVFQLQVLPGLNPLYLQPRLQTNAVPVVGTPGISIKRAAQPGTRTASDAVPERPFYELDEEEHIALEAESAMPIVPAIEAPPAETKPQPAAPTAAAPQAPPKRARQQNAPAPAVVEPVAAKPEPPALVAAEPVTAEPARPAPAPAVVEPVAAEPVPPAKQAKQVPAADTRMSRFRTLQPNDIALLERLFAGEKPGVVAHFVMISTLACNEPESGDDATGFAAFLRTDGEALGRALVLARLGKTVDYRITQTSLDALSLPWEPALARTASPRRLPRRLRRDLSETECRAIAGLVQSSPRDPQLRLRIALLALAAASIEGVSRASADECLTALASYRSVVLAWLIPLCVASMKTPLPTLPDPPANVDAAGARVAAALRAAFAS